jgi:hypothetical protein
LTHFDENEPMAALPTAVIMHIVIELACFDSPAPVAATVKEKLGVHLSRQRIEAYHPERAAGARLGTKWRTVFYNTRARLLAELDNIPLACRSYRLRVLERVAGQAEEMGNLQLAARIIEQAAREASDTG